MRADILKQVFVNDTLDRIGVDKVADVVRQLSTGRTTWADVTQQFPKFEAQETKS